MILRRRWDCHVHGNRAVFYREADLHEAAAVLRGMGVAVMRVGRLELRALTPAN